LRDKKYREKKNVENKKKIKLIKKMNKGCSQQFSSSEWIYQQRSLRCLFLSLSLSLSLLIRILCHATLASIYKDPK